MKYTQSPLIPTRLDQRPSASWFLIFLVVCLFALVSHWDYLEGKRMECVSQGGTVQADDTCKLSVKPLPPVKPANLRGQKGK